MAVSATSLRIVRLDPPFAYARQMVLEDGSRVPYDADAIAAQQERDRFPQSLARGSELIRQRAGLARLHLADLRDEARLEGAALRVAVYTAALREAA